MSKAHAGGYHEPRLHQLKQRNAPQKLGPKQPKLLFLGGRHQSAQNPTLRVRSPSL